MDALLRQWQARRLPKARPLHDARPDPQRRPASDGRRAPDDLVVIEAGQVTVQGNRADLDRLAVAAGVYGGEGHRPTMSKDEDHVMTGVYIGVGLLVAAGAGYLAWRYLLDDAQKQKLVNTTKDLVADGLTQGKRAVRDARGKIHL